jgi:hypothetical protein
MCAVLVVLFDCVYMVLGEIKSEIYEDGGIRAA